MLNKLIPHKFPAFDSLRGIAAIMVVCQHLWEMNNGADDRLRPWWFFCAGHEAVILFFVLSGFVLSHQLRDFKFNVASDYASFILRRIFRIYPAYYVSLIISVAILIYIRYYAHSDLSEFDLKPWFYIWYKTAFDKTLVIGSLTLLSHEGNSLNLSTWTLYYEMWLSLIFPSLLWLISRSNYWLRLISLVFLLWLSYRAWQTGTFLDNRWLSIIYYSWYFIGGILLYQSYSYLKVCAKPLFLVLGLLFYFSNYLLFGEITNRMLHEIVIALGSGLILLNCLHNQGWQRFLNWPVFNFYGRISYSLYLLHLPVLYLCSYLLLSHYSLIIVKLFVFGLSTLLATFSYYLVERYGVAKITRNR